MVTRHEQNYPDASTTCPHCGVEVREDRLNRHIRKVHSSLPSLKKHKAAKAVRKPAMHGSPYAIISCQQCGASVYERHLEGHIRQFHQTTKQKSRSNTKATENKKRKPTRKVRSKTRSRGRIFYIDKNGFVATRETLNNNQRRSKPLYERLAPGARINKDKELEHQEPAYQKISKVSEIKKLNTSSNDLLQCPYCPSPVKRKNIWNHVCKHHPGKNPEDAMTGIKPYQRRRSKRMH